MAHTQGQMEPTRKTASNDDERLSPKAERFRGRLGRLSLDETPLPPMDLAKSSAPIPPANSNKEYRHWLKGDILSRAPYLATMRDGRIREGECRISYYASNESEILLPYDKIMLNKGSEDGLKVGDSYDLYEVGENAYGYSSIHQIGKQIIPNGRAEVVAVKSHAAAARLTQCFGTISRSTRASPSGKGKEDFSISKYAPVAGTRPSAQVVWVPGSGQLPLPFNYVIIDKGSEAGFKLGDHLLLLNQKSGKITDYLLGEGLIVHVEPQSATVLVHDVFPGIINPGDYAYAVQSPEP